MKTIDQVNQYLADKFATDISADELPGDVDLIGTGILTSLTTVQLLGWCGHTFQVPINSIAINPDHLRTPRGIAEFIDAHRTDAD